MKLLVRLWTAPIRFYQRFLSPLKPPTCRFDPSCSAYALEAVEKHGILRGTLLATWRILRCQPFARGGHDPVPPLQELRENPASEGVQGGGGACNPGREGDTAEPPEPGS